MKRQPVIGIDHNMDLLKCSENHKTQKFLDCNLENKMMPCITKPTRITHSSATLIDNIFCDMELHNLCYSNIVINDISNHLPGLTVFENILPTIGLEKSTRKRKLTEKTLKRSR